VRRDSPAAILRATQTLGIAVPKIWIDGKYYEKDDAKVSVFDHGVLYGDGVFEGIRAYGGKVFRLKLHIDRLYASAKTILLDIPMTPAAVIAMVEDCIRVNALSDAYLRLVVTRGIGDLGLDPRKCAKATVFCIADKIALWPPDVYERGLSLVTVSTPVNTPNGLPPQVKSLNYLSHIMGKVEAINAGADEALMLEATGEVAEGSGQNLFCVNGRLLRTPPGFQGILRGVTRQAVIELGREAGYEVREETITRYDLYTADEVFLTGTAAEIIGVTKVDGRVLSGGKVGPVTRDLAARFKQLAARGG
jgi:branched-chain amino acid aminotransferase